MQLTELLDIINNLYYINSPSWRVVQSKQKELLSIVSPATDITKIDSKVINKYIKALQSRDNSNATLNSKLSVLSKALNYALRNDLIKSMPYIPYFKVESSKDRFITLEEESIMIDYCYDNNLDELWDVIIIGLNTGLRINEILSITPESIDNNYIRIWKNKTNKPNSIPMNTTMKELFKDFTPFTLNYTQIEYQFKRMITELNLQDITLHTLRHTFCSRLVQKDIPLTTIQKLANHKNYNTTLRYAHLSNKNLEDAVNCL